MVLAVLEAHCGVRLGTHDVYLNVAGGLRIQEPAADLAAAAALVSSLANAPLPADAVYFGEISLSGAVRPVPQSAARLKEAAKLGFARAVLPEAARGDADANSPHDADRGRLAREPRRRRSRRASRDGGRTRRTERPVARRGRCLDACAESAMLFRRRITGPQDGVTAARPPAIHVARAPSREQFRPHRADLRI